MLNWLDLSCPRYIVVKNLLHSITIIVMMTVSIVFI